jgi:hypothetical protein
MIIFIYKWLKKTVFLKTGEHWAQHGFWEFDVYQNGGRKPSLLYTTFNQHWSFTKTGSGQTYQKHWKEVASGGFWGTPSGWVLPVIARNDSAVAEQLVRDAINDCRRNGAETSFSRRFIHRGSLLSWQNRIFTKTGSGQAQGGKNWRKEGRLFP